MKRKGETMELILAQVEGLWIFLGVLILVPLAIIFYAISIYNGLGRIAMVTRTPSVRSMCN